MPNLTPLVRSFVAHVGEMGSRWGINRTVGQIHALIFVAAAALNAIAGARREHFAKDRRAKKAASALNACAACTT